MNPLICPQVIEIHTTLLYKCPALKYQAFSGFVSFAVHGAENPSGCTGAVGTFQKGALWSAFLTCSQFPSNLAFRKPKAFASQQRKRERERHLKLNLKMCFFWTPVCEAINQGRHFHTPHFSWLRSEFPPFLVLHLGFGYLLPYWLQTTGDGASAPREKHTTHPLWTEPGCPWPALGPEADPRRL